MNCLNDQLILCETGIGAFFEPKLADRFGVQNPDRHLLLENLKAAGFQPEDINYVILSHLHFDHAGGLVSKFDDGPMELVFPKAKFIVGKTAWDRALNPHFRDRASFVPEINKLLQDSGHLLIVDENQESPIFPEQLQFITSEGHTPGQMHSLIVGNNHSIFFAGDLIPGRHWVHLPITMGYDRYPEKLIEEKHDLYANSVTENDLVFFTHDDSYSAARVAKNEKGKYQPLDLKDKLVGLEF